MELEVNGSHKKIAIDKLKNPLKKLTIGGLISLSLFSGATPNRVYAEDMSTSQSVEYSTDDLSMVVSIPDAYKYDVASKVGKTTADDVTIGDLNNVDYLFLNVVDDSSLEFLKYCSNLNNLIINCNCENLDCIKSISCPNLANLSISNLWYDCSLSSDDVSFIDNCLNLSNLSLIGVKLNPGVEDDLNKLDSLSLDYANNVYTCDIDFSKLTGLKKLDVSNIKPYDLAIFLNSYEYNTLVNNGVNIEFASEEKQQYLDASSKLDSIVSELGVTMDSSDEEKLNAILIYTLEHLSYDENVSIILSQNGDTNGITAPFYENGSLYGALYKDSAICGNYSALVEALNDRLGNPKSSSIMISNNHAWNVMNVDGETYYVDATWLDSQNKYILVEDYANSTDSVINYVSKEVSASDMIKDGDTGSLSWYMEDTDSNYIATIDQKNSHVPVYDIPDYMFSDSNTDTIHGNYVPVSETENASYDLQTESNNNESEQDKDVETENIQTERKNRTDDSNKKFKVTINGKTMVISGAALVGILAGLGVAIKKSNENKKRKRDAERRRMQRELYGYDDLFSNNNGYRRR